MLNDCDSCLRQAMGMFSSALASGQLGPLLSQFGLPAEAVDAANKGGERHTDTQNYSPVTIFKFFDVLWTMRIWLYYLMQSLFTSPPVVLLSLLCLSTCFLVFIFELYFYFFLVRCGGVCQSHAGDQRRLQREERGRWGHESGLELTPPPPTSLNSVPVKICDSFHFSIFLDLLFSVKLS